MRGYTVFVEFPGEGVEEIDVEASSMDHARRETEKVLAAAYEPGGKIIEIRRNMSGVFYY